MSFPRYSVVILPLICLSAAVGQTNVRNISVTFTTIDVPGAVYTEMIGINSAGDIVGNYGQDTSQDSHGFMYSNGAFTYFDYPGQTFTVPHAINDMQVIAGYVGISPVFGFIYDGTNFASVNDGNNSATVVLGINNAAELVGGAGTIYTTKGFASRSGVFKTLNVPGAYTYVYGSGVNNTGAIVGWTDSDSFMCRGTNCKIMDFPGASHTEVEGINDSGMMVGWYTVPYTCVGCAFVEKNGKYLSFAYPGAAFTAAGGINKSGVIVGAYTFDYNVWHGFITNPITDADFQ
jgi:hypothetical protein